ncbi:hypothetical protein MKK67_00500 [Methylobacterium sp. J-072]|uniref:hypothetical protein n=1 Tax=Methylobacterium sp. J-072 TaxID=2836651 RepID=UPI001FBA36A8|nr:hypothetical protein [Methylobacterium sp. J-072]MCJ2090995.1 hypothetical protein [Methylobacterium sp. J-072]
MSDERRLIFYIDAYSPETIPMAKLAEYMADFAALLGKDNAVHFAGLEKGSTKIAVRIEHEDLPKVTARLSDVRRGNPTKEMAKVFDQIDDRLANDNAVGRIYIDGPDEAVALLAFPGRTRQKPQSYGPFNQEGHLDGILISVGGKDESISLRLQNGDTTYTNCDTTRHIARELGKHLFEPLRIHGTGRWTREANGKWTLLRFRVHRFDVLKTDSLSDTVHALRSITGSQWKDIADPLAELENLRRDDEGELH